MYEKIKAFCDERHIPIAQFERLIGRKKGYVAKLKDSAPGIRSAVRIAQVMGVSVEELLDEQAGTAKKP